MTPIFIKLMFSVLIDIPCFGRFFGLIFGRFSVHVLKVVNEIPSKYKSLYIFLGDFLIGTLRNCQGH